MTKTMSVALVLAALVIFASVPATQAKEVSASGTATYVTVSENTVEHEDGTIVRHTTIKTILEANDTSVPFHLAVQTCPGITVIQPDGVAQSNGSCYSVDRDGDHWWIWWHNGSDASTWGFLGGTGKWEGVEGGGTSQQIVQHPDGFVITWEGTWTMK